MNNTNYIIKQKFCHRMQIYKKGYLKLSSSFQNQLVSQEFSHSPICSIISMDWGCVTDGEREKSKDYCLRWSGFCLLDDADVVGFYAEEWGVAVNNCSVVSQKANDFWNGLWIVRLLYCCPRYYCISVLFS
jgi:hypothetical protein